MGRVLFILFATILVAAPLSAQSSSDPTPYRGTNCVGSQCAPYMLFLYPDRHFADSKGRIGTYTRTTSRLTLDFVGIGRVILAPNGLNCWQPAGGAVNPAIGQINTCLAAPGYQTLTHDGSSPGTCYARILSPADGEEGHWSATVHSPNGFIVTAVSYYLWDGDPGNGSPCDGGYAHRVHVYLDDDATPDADPVVVAEFDVDLGVVTPDDDTLVRLVLENPVRVEPGQHVFVAIEHAADATHEICTTACDSAFTEDTNFWSNAADVPYGWVTIESFGAAHEYNNRYYVHGFAF
jgi:hypothetical protein